ncbi:cytosolic long-chain acyl-CoA thioester hydrolase family protein [Stutzerimonas stutzeri]|nr:cytosolic long-chain acyl-CoA thioester hydrolase family protein [Stutzerimonas stutzeri]
MLDGHAELTMTVLMTPDKANFSGNVHGGTLLKYLDEVAYACASRYAGQYVVTLSVDQVVFRQPVHVGELVTFLASVNYTGTTSMEIGIKVVTEDIRSKTVRHTNSCFFTMVALGEDGKPVPVPPLNPKTPNSSAASPRPTSAARSVVSWNTATASCVPVTSASPPCSKLYPGIDVVLAGLVATSPAL